MNEFPVDPRLQTKKRRVRQTNTKSDEARRAHARAQRDAQIAKAAAEGRVFKPRPSKWLEPMDAKMKKATDTGVGKHEVEFIYFILSVI